MTDFQAALGYKQIVKYKKNLKKRQLIAEQYIKNFSNIKNINHLRDFIHIDDVSKATQLIADKGRVGDCYHIATTSTVTIRELVELICQKILLLMRHHY